MRRIIVLLCVLALVVLPLSLYVSAPAPEQFSFRVTEAYEEADRDFGEVRIRVEGELCFEGRASRTAVYANSFFVIAPCVNGDYFVVNSRTVTDAIKTQSLHTKTIKPNAPVSFSGWTFYNDDGTAEAAFVAEFMIGFRQYEIRQIIPLENIVKL